MTFGEVREFDFYPFYVRLRGIKMPVPLSGVDTLIMSGRIDATPYPSTMLRAIPEGYVRLPYGLALGPEALDLVLVSSVPLSEVASLGVIKGYEFVLHLLEDVLRKGYGINVRSLRISVFSDLVPGVDAYLLYGDIALRMDGKAFGYTYNMARAYHEVMGKPVDVAFWIAREDKAGDVESQVGNSLAYWMLRRDEILLRYARERKIPFETLYAHTESLLFRVYD